MSRSTLTLEQLASTLTAQRDAKQDLLVNTRALTFEPNATTGSLALDIKGEGRVVIPMSEHAVKDVAGLYGIPMSYVDRLRYGVKEVLKTGKTRVIVAPQPELLAENINKWFSAQPLERMIRTFRGLGPTDVVRAVLSDKFRPIDHYDIAEMTLPVLQSNGLKVLECQVTETRLYIKAVSEKVTGELKVGDMVQAGVVISNSETGDGSFKIEPFLWRLICLNGMVTGFALRTNHVGRRHSGNGDSDFEGARQFFSDETREADDKALMLKARDTVVGAVDEARFASVVDKFRETMDVSLGNDAPKLAEVVAKKHGFTEGEKVGFLAQLMIERSRSGNSADVTGFEAINAVTALAHEVESYDRQIELERLGGNALENVKSTFSLN